MLQEFMTLVERYDPGYHHRIQGASQEEIRHLETLMGQSLPNSYREFLAHLGRNMGGIEVDGVSFHIDRIVEFYRDGHWPPPAGFILFGVQEEDPCFDYYLECHEATAQDCPVVRFPSEGEFSRKGYFESLDPSLTDFLLSLAFSEKRMKDFDLQRVLAPSRITEESSLGLITKPADIARTLDERAHHLGFERVAKSSAAYRFYDHQDAALYVRFDESDGNLVVTVAAQKPRDLERFSDILCNKTSLTVL